MRWVFGRLAPWTVRRVVVWPALRAVAALLALAYAAAAFAERLEGGR